jgi:hypothetical protein
MISVCDNPKYVECFPHTFIYVFGRRRIPKIPNILVLNYRSDRKLPLPRPSRLLSVCLQGEASREKPQAKGTSEPEQ